MKQQPKATTEKTLFGKCWRVFLFFCTPEQFSSTAKYQYLIALNSNHFRECRNRKLLFKPPMEEKQGDQTRFCPVPENLSIYQNKTSKSKYQGRDIGEMEGEEFISL
jgi:hypothetical protein